MYRNLIPWSWLMQLLICGYSGCNSISGCSKDYIMNLPSVGHQKIVCSFIEHILAEDIHTKLSRAISVNFECEGCVPARIEVLIICITKSAFKAIWAGVMSISPMSVTAILHMVKKSWSILKPLPITGPSCEFASSGHYKTLGSVCQTGITFITNSRHK